MKIPGSTAKYWIQDSKQSNVCFPLSGLYLVLLKFNFKSEFIIEQQPNECSADGYLHCIDFWCEADDSPHLNLSMIVVFKSFHRDTYTQGRITHVWKQATIYTDFNNEIVELDRSDPAPPWTTFPDTAWPIGQLIYGLSPELST